MLDVQNNYQKLIMSDAPSKKTSLVACGHEIFFFLLLICFTAYVQYITSWRIANNPFYAFVSLSSHRRMGIQKPMLLLYFAAQSSQLSFYPRYIESLKKNKTQTCQLRLTVNTIIDLGKQSHQGTQSAGNQQTSEQLELKLSN